MFVTAKAKVYTDATGVYTQLPVLLTPAGVLEPLLDYFLHHSHNRSLEWMFKVIRSTRLFLEYLQVNSTEQDSYILFRNFAQRLYTGTFELGTGLDPTNLCWKPFTPHDASRIICNLSDFFEWLGEKRPEIAQINPRYSAGMYDRITDEIAYNFRRNKALLGHTWATHVQTRQKGRFIRSQSAPKLEQSNPPAFPDSKFEELLLKGFKVSGRYDYRGMLITLLLHGAGFRESEPFHLYISDVFPDPADLASARVHIHHPTFGEAPPDWKERCEIRKKANRAEYLSQQFSIAPRTKLMGSRHAGWKGGTHDEPYFKRAFWFTPEYGHWFLQVWYRYLEQVVRIERSHPFAFINLNRKPIGEMYSLAQYNKAHAAACKRIGLIVSKAKGTTPHGHRHAYGRRLKNAGINEHFIRRFMHHSSIDSQDVYTMPSTKEILEVLKIASINIEVSKNNQLVL